MWALLGDIEFEICDSFESYTENKSVSYSQTDIVEGKPKIQFLGENLNTLSIKIQISNLTKNSDEIINKLKIAMSEGKSLPIIFSYLTYKGDYIVTNYSLSVERTDPFGNILLAAYDVDLIENPISEEEKTEKEKEAIRIKTQQANSATLINVLPKRTINNLKEFIENI